MGKPHFEKIIGLYEKIGDIRQEVHYFLFLPSTAAKAVFSRS
jgi:hypothetical protein